MIPRPPACLDALVQAFFTEYLPHQRALSPRTVESYRDALRLLLEFIELRTAKPAAGIELCDFTPDLIQAFLDHLEYERHNSVHSRNLRLAAVRAFLKFAAPSDTSPQRTIESALRVPMKRFTRTKPEFLSREQMLAIIGSPDGSWIGQRDHTLLSVLYDTAATVSEVVRLRLQNLELEGEPCVHFRGTRRAQRTAATCDRGGPARLAGAQSGRDVQFGAVSEPARRGYDRDLHPASAGIGGSEGGWSRA